MSNPYGLLFDIYNNHNNKTYRIIINKHISKGRFGYMSKSLPSNSNSDKNREHFINELKLFVNKKLFEKHIITEDMYHTAKEFLLKQAI